MYFTNLLFYHNAIAIANLRYISLKPPLSQNVGFQMDFSSVCLYYTVVVYISMHFFHSNLKVKAKGYLKKY